MPRVCKVLERQGAGGGKACDLNLGWNFDRRIDRQACWDEIERDNPDLTIGCPPCGSFSSPKEWNYPRMDPEKARAKLSSGLHHLRLTMKTLRQRHLQGRYFLFEHPLTAKSWSEPEVQEIKGMDGVFFVRGDVCQFNNLRIIVGELSKKASGFMANCPMIAKELEKPCPGGHRHAPLLHGTYRPLG